MLDANRANLTINCNATPAWPGPFDIEIDCVAIR